MSKPAVLYDEAEIKVSLIAIMQYDPSAMRRIRECFDFYGLSYSPDKRDEDLGEIIHELFIKLSLDENYQLEDNEVRKSFLILGLVDESGRMPPYVRSVVMSEIRFDDDKIRWMRG